MNRKIVLVGKSCSGKTELSLILNKKGFRSALSCTSRTIRPIEEDGIHYDFVTLEKFREMIEQDKFIEYDEFNSWFYGLTKERYAECNLLILTPRGLKHLLKKVNRNELLIIYMNTPADERMKRAIYRGDDPAEVKRRYAADEKDFADYEAAADWDIALDYKISDKFEILLDLFSEN
jgi:guanylate kinase